MAGLTQLFDHPHRRFNALTGDWVAVSPHRDQRPWRGQTESLSPITLPPYDRECYLCPGNVRASGERNPHYESTYVFQNDFAALFPDTLTAESLSHPLLRAASQSGSCRVLCLSPRHDLSLAQLPVPQIRVVIQTWIDHVAELSQRWRWVQLFENKGELMGCSNPHPHAQIWASDAMPTEPTQELTQQREWFVRKRSPLLLDYVDAELAAGERVIILNEHWVVLVPWWAVWPFETLLLPRRAVQQLPQLTGPERDSLADILKRLLVRYDNLFETPFPYSFGWHGAPSGQTDGEHWQLHAHFYPPLLRSATVKKFMVGYEMLAEAQRDLAAEQAAARLRAQSEIHYQQGGCEPKR